MSSIINSFLLLSLFARVAILFFIIFVFWLLFGRKILWFLSLTPFLLERLFRYFYLLIEVPVAALHKKLGTSFYKIDNKLSQFGEKIDSAMLRWYNAWHSSKKIHLGKSLLVYVLCVAFITFPSFMKLETNAFRTGEIVYLHCETFLVDWIVKRGWYDHSEPVSLNQDIQVDQHIQSESEPFDMKLIVSGLKSSLLVRDIPSTENCIVLDRLYNGNTVVWSGRLVFSEADNDHIEPWAKVITPNGIEGWARLFYLHPEQYEDIELYVQTQE